MDVRGPQFSTYVQGQQVDTWTDDQLKVGGGGLPQRTRRARRKSNRSRFRYLNGGDNEHDSSQRVQLEQTNDQWLWFDR